MRTGFRRAVLLGGIAASAYVFTACGGDSVTDPLNNPGPGQGQVLTSSFNSAALGVSKHYVIYLPPTYRTDSTKHYPVVYFLHGTTGTQRSWIDDMHVNNVLDSLIKAGSPEMIGVLVDGDNAYYHNWTTSYDYSACLANAEQKPASDYCVKQMRYGDYVVTDLVAHIDANYRTQASASHRGIVGNSMGGYGAVYLSTAYPNVFSAAASLSGAWLSLLHLGSYPGATQATAVSQLSHQDTTYWSLILNQYGTSITNWRLYDPYSIVTAAHNAGGAIPALWLVAGATDSQTLTDNQIFHAQLTQLGVPHTYATPSGGHTISFWTAHEGEAIAWMGTKIGS